MQENNEYFEEVTDTAGNNAEKPDLPGAYYGDNYNLEQEMSDLTEKELDEVRKITSATERMNRDRLDLPENGHRSIISAVLALIFSIASIPTAFIPPLGYIFAALSLGLVAFFRVKFGFFIRIAVLALIFSMCGVTVSAFVSIIKLVTG